MNANRSKFFSLAITGSEKAGYQTFGDVRYTRDGESLAAMWAELQAVQAAANAERDNIVNFLSYKETQPIKEIPVGAGMYEFEEASEFGVPQASGQSEETMFMGLPFKWYDKASRFTWQYLADATSDQIRRVTNGIIEADNRTVFKQALRALFRNTNQNASIKGQPYNVYALYNNDGMAPPTYKTNSFNGTHTHYLVSGGATVTSANVDAMEDNLSHHGFSSDNGMTLALVVNETEAAVIRNFRSVPNGGSAKYDFIASNTQPIALIPRDMVVPAGNTRPQGTLNGMNVIGSYGNLLIVQENWMPPGYMLSFATGGTANLRNPVAIREHANASYRGLRLLAGPTPEYPLQNSYWSHGYGFGVVERGGAVLMQVKASGNYAIPTEYV